MLGALYIITQDKCKNLFIKFFSLHKLCKFFKKLISSLKGYSFSVQKQFVDKIGFFLNFATMHFIDKKCVLSMIDLKKLDDITFLY